MTPYLIGIFVGLIFGVPIGIFLISILQHDRLLSTEHDAARFRALQEHAAPVGDGPLLATLADEIISARRQRGARI